MFNHFNHNAMKGSACELCLIRFRTPLDGPMSRFCPQCRTRFTIRDDKDAQDMLEMVDAGQWPPSSALQADDKKGQGKEFKEQKRFPLPNNLKPR